MIDIHHIQDANLISARFHAIDLEVEALCGELMALLDALLDSADAALTRLWMAAVDVIEDRLTTLVIHVWPSPKDPVVVGLRAAASSMVDRARLVKAQLD